MGNGAKIALVAVLAAIVAVVALWDRTNEEKHRSGLQGLPVAPLEPIAVARPAVKTLAREPAPEDHVRGEMRHGPLAVAPPSAPVPVPVPVPAAAPPLPASAPIPPPPPPAPERYVIRPRDTLSAIADAHYGSKRHWRKIADANPGVIKDPDRLPIGKEIVIPPLEPRAPAATLVGGTREATTLRPSLAQVSEITTVPASGTGTGTGRGRGPGQRYEAGGKVYYVVAKGDTLSSIAQKLLGDKRRWRLLYEANRDKLKDPESVREGQHLEFPQGR